MQVVSAGLFPVTDAAEKDGTCIAFADPPLSRPDGRTDLVTL